MSDEMIELELARLVPRSTAVDPVAAAYAAGRAAGRRGVNRWRGVAVVAVSCAAVVPWVVPIDRPVTPSARRPIAVRRGTMPADRSPVLTAVSGPSSMPADDGFAGLDFRRLPELPRRPVARPDGSGPLF